MYFEFSGKCTNLHIRNVLLENLITKSAKFVKISYEDYTNITLETWVLNNVSMSDNYQLIDYDSNAKSVLFNITDVTV